jgi:hypothetical protein
MTNRTMTWRVRFNGPKKDISITERARYRSRDWEYAFRQSDTKVRREMGKVRCIVKLGHLRISPSHLRILGENVRVDFSLMQTYFRENATWQTFKCMQRETVRGVGKTECILHFFLKRIMYIFDSLFMYSHMLTCTCFTSIWDKCEQFKFGFEVMRNSLNRFSQYFRQMYFKMQF